LKELYFQPAIRPQGGCLTITSLIAMKYYVVPAEAFEHDGEGTPVQEDCSPLGAKGLRMASADKHR